VLGAQRVGDPDEGDACAAGGFVEDVDDGAGGDAARGGRVEGRRILHADADGFAAGAIAHPVHVREAVEEYCGQSHGQESPKPDGPDTSKRH